MAERFVKGFAALVVTIVFLAGLCNFVDQMHHADNKGFWLDERYSLKNTVQAHTYMGLLAKGAALTEFSPAPLDYLFVKMLDDIKPAVHSFGTSDKVYYRLWANVVMVFSGLVVVWLLAGDIVRSPVSGQVRIFQLLLLLFLPLIYLYRPMTYHYAAEVRPYSLWFALWFITIAACSLSRISKFFLALCLSLLAMTMSGSVFQILSVAMAYLSVQWLRNGWKQALKDALQVSIVPLVLVVFYAYPAQYGHMSDEPRAHAWQRFYELWGHDLFIIPMLLVAIVSLSFSKRTQPMITGPLAVLIVFLMGPAIFTLTLDRGYFFTERQYIYYDVHRAVFWLAFINFLPFYLEKIKDDRKQFLAMALVFALWMPAVFSKKTIFYIRTVADHTRSVIFKP